MQSRLHAQIRTDVPLREATVVAFLESALVDPEILLGPLLRAEIISKRELDGLVHVSEMRSN